MKHKKYRNIMTYATFKEAYENGEIESAEFTCRGCAFRNRANVLNNYIASISSDINFKSNNSYLFFETEPDNKYDDKAIMIVCGGEIFGTVGYVGREFIDEVHKILDSCDEYRIEFNPADIGTNDMTMNIYYIVT